MIFTLIIGLIFMVLFIFIVIAGGNYMLRYMVDKALENTENFTNRKSDDISIINPIDDCKKIDILTDNQLNFQTATNIPLSPNKYNNYIGKIYMNDDENDKINPFQDGTYCMRKPKLLYDGIWDPNIEKKSPYEYENWNLTNGNLTDGYYCSNKLIQQDKTLNKNFVDTSAVSIDNSGKYYTYFNDCANDKYDTEIQCFPSVFNAGITEDLKKKFD
jgi:hypothetical protein